MSGLVQFHPDAKARAFPSRKAARSSERRICRAKRDRVGWQLVAVSVRRRHQPMLTLHHQPDRRETYREMHPYRFDRELGCLCVVDPEIIASVFRSDKFNVIFFADQYRYITENTRVQAGLTRENIAWAFTTTRVSNWHPLTWISHMSDVQIYKFIWTKMDQ